MIELFYQKSNFVLKETSLCLTEAATKVVLRNKCFEKFLKLHRKTPVLESLLTKLQIY